MAGASEANVDRRERLRKLALETIDINKVGDVCLRTCEAELTIFAHLT